MATANTNTFTLTIGTAPTPPSNVDAGGPYTGDQSSAISISATYTPGTGANPTDLWTIESGGTGTFGNAATKDTTFTPDAVGAYVLKFTASNDAGSASDTANLTSNAPAGAPTVDAGGDYSGDEQTAIALDTASVQNGTDPNPTITWSVEAGSPDTDSGQFSSTSIVNPTFTPSTDGAYVLKLAVDANDWPEVSDTANLTATVAPVAGLNYEDLIVYLQGGQNYLSQNILDSSENSFDSVVADNEFVFYDELAFKFAPTSISSSLGNTNRNAGYATSTDSYANSSWTAGLWFQRPTLVGYNGTTKLLTNTSGFPQSGRWSLYIDSAANTFYFDSPNITADITTPISAGEWAFVCVVVDVPNSKISILYDDNGDGFLQEIGSTAATAIDWGQSLYLGKDSTGTTVAGQGGEFRAQEAFIAHGLSFAPGYSTPTAPFFPPIYPTAPYDVDAGGDYSGDQNNSISIAATYRDGNLPTTSTLWTSNRPGEGSFLDANAADTEFTPTGTGAYILTFTATNDEGSDSDTANLTSNIVGTPIDFTGSISDYTLIVDVTMNPSDVSGNWEGSLTPFTFTSIGTALPPGLSLSSAGVISGTPTSIGVTNNCQIEGEDTSSNTAASNFFDFNVIDTPTGLGGIRVGTQGEPYSIFAGEDQVFEVFAGETLVWSKPGIYNTVKGTVASLPAGNTLDLDISSWNIKDGDVVLLSAGGGFGDGGVEPEEIAPGVEWDRIYSRGNGERSSGAGWLGYIDSDRAQQLSTIRVIPTGTGITDPVDAVAIHLRGYQFPAAITETNINTNSGSYANPLSVDNLLTGQLIICSATLLISPETGYTGTWEHPGFEMIDSMPRVGFSQLEDYQTPPTLFDPDPYSSDPIQAELPTWLTVTYVFNRR